MEFLGQVGILVWKDLQVELRSREIVYTTLFFAVLVTVIFAFALLRHAGAGERVAPGILWVALTFAGTLGMSRSFEREREDGCLRGILLTRISRPAVFVGKLLTNLLLMALTAAALLPLVGLFFDPRLLSGAHLPAMLLILGLGIAGFAAVGTLLSAGLSGARMRHVLLPILTYPLMLPAIIGCVMATTRLLEPGPEAAAATTGWIILLGGFDAVFVTAATLLFEPLVSE